MFEQVVDCIKRFSSFFMDVSISNKDKTFLVKEVLAWWNSRNKPLYNKSLKLGEVYTFNFGINHAPEMSFYHMGIIIAKNNYYFYVLPITTYDPAKNAHKSAIDITSASPRKSAYYLMKKSDYSFLDNDSVIKTNEIRTVAHSRAVKSKGKIDPSSDLFKAITSIAFEYTFPSKYSEIDTKNKNISLLEMQLYLIKLQDFYTVKNFDDFINQLSVPAEFVISSNTPTAISENTYEYILELSDMYKQTERKKITYTIKQ